MGGKSRLPVLGDFPIVDGIMNSWASPQCGSLICECFKESGGMLSKPVALWGFKSLKSFQVISSIISFTFNVVYLPSVFQIISTKLLIKYICDIPIHHKENKQAELTRPS